ncbi:RagB/SusD family nutrient uptake outer membrane protein [Sphingobacterium wenxiniae]|uniref:SusD family protein n=1 Tax=Sphingobacterium wenxiniae TaxID=683125 RepID=A0A1I6VQK5_9SPHI|nr:RagB/SusD family nutrient uptake outer membrane protein [Sphingobacterium wenxiniae]SFT15861.1 SusD family protein [Sphingobacterium wenxiniae]
MNRYLILLNIYACCFIVSSCSSEWLDKKPDQKIAMITSIDDLQALLDNHGVMNSNTPYMGELSLPYYTIKEGELEQLSTPDRNTYMWKNDLYEGYDPIVDWDWNYRKIFYANVVLHELDRFPVDDVSKNTRSAALFFRAWANYHLVQLFCQGFDRTTAHSVLGLPIKTTADIHDIPQRSSLLETYQHIVDDLQESLYHHVDIQGSNLIRPNASAIRALLSKVFLLMGDYEKSLHQAEAIIKNTNAALLDYKQLDETAKYPFSLFNNEVIFHASILPTNAMTVSRLLINQEFYDSYDDFDLRKKLFFRHEGDGTLRFKGSYCESDEYFSGITLGEIYLIAAECNVRIGKGDKGVEFLMDFLRKRYERVDQLQLRTDKLALLKAVIEERKKELVLRGLGWGDLKRYNLEEDLAMPIVRSLSGQIIEMPANDNRYTMPIPEKVVKLSGLVQNIR